MLKIRSNLTVVVVLAAITGLVFLVGCGDSQEKKQMTEFIQEFGKTVEAYAKAEDGQKAELAAKVKADMAKWTEMKNDMGDELTPQVFDKLNNEYKKLAKEFKKLSGQS